MTNAELQPKIDNALTVVRCREHLCAHWPENVRLKQSLEEAREDLRRLEAEKFQAMEVAP